MSLAGFNILLGVTGGIAAYKSAYLTRLLVKDGAEVQVVMTKAGAKFVTPLTFEALTGREVATAMFPKNRFAGTHHIVLAEWPDLIVVAPATADFIAQIAQGHCASLLAAVIMASRKKVIFAPAMNEGMYAHPAVQRNLATLRQYGYQIAEVGVGDMACRSFGPGRMAEPEEILELIKKALKGGGPLAGKRVLVTAGPCREAIDPVRFISNRSSGKMGFAMAVEAEKLGADVTLVTGPVALPDPPRMTTVRIETTAEMGEVVAKRFETADYLIMAAAPADYRPAESRPQKIKKGDASRRLDLEPTVDILKSLQPKRRSGQVVVGFSLETENEVENSKKKLREKDLDFIVINNPLEEGAGFETDTNRVAVMARNGEIREFDKDSKVAIAKKIWGYIVSHGLGR